MGAPLFVGFNRRYAPLAVELRELPGPRLMAYRVNAGPLPTRPLDQRPRPGRRPPEGRGVPLHRLPLRPGRERSGDRERPRLRRPVPTSRWRRPTTSASRSTSPTAAWARFTTRPIRRSARARSASRPARPASTRRSRTIGAGGSGAGSRKQRLGGGRQDKGFAAQFKFRSPRFARRGGGRRRPRASGFLGLVDARGRALASRAGTPETVLVPESGARRSAALVGPATDGGSDGWWHGR